MSIFKGIGDAPINVDANYMRKGHYIARIDECVLKDTRKSGTMALITMTVIDVLDPDSTNKVGERVTQGIRQQSDYFFSDILGFISAATGTDMSDADEKAREEAAVAVFSGDNPLANTVVEVRARDIETQKGGTFTKINYRREVLPNEVKELLDDESINRFFPDNALDTLAEANA